MVNKRYIYLWRVMDTRFQVSFMTCSCSNSSMNLHFLNFPEEFNMKHTSSLDRECIRGKITFCPEFKMDVFRQISRFCQETLCLARAFCWPEIYNLYVLSFCSKNAEQKWGEQIMESKYSHKLANKSLLNTNLDNWYLSNHRFAESIMMHLISVYHVGIIDSTAFWNPTPRSEDQV